MTAPARELVQLPNKDLWRGRTFDPTKDIPAEVQQVEDTPAPSVAPIDKAMAAILAFSAGKAQLDCVWCGLQGDEKFMRAHLKKDHKSVVEPAVDAAIAVADAQQARDALAAATKE
jgi:hypothetical protein